MRTIVFSALLVVAFPLTAQSLRYFGTGTGDIDRVKIAIDDPATNLPGPPADIGSGDFTIEFWLRALPGTNTAPAIQCGANYNWIVGNTIYDRDRYEQWPGHGISIGAGRVAFGTLSSGQQTTICANGPDVRDGLWHHVAVQRRYNDGQMTIYVDGQLRGSGTMASSANLSYPDNGQPVRRCGGGAQLCSNDSYLVIGAEKADADVTRYPAFNGWLDELRLSVRIRYTASFVPPQAPFTVDADTAALYHFDENNGTDIADAVGQSPGVRRVGGSQNGPQWSIETPFGGSVPADTQAPTTPSGVQATPTSSSQVNLTWTASTDNVGVTSYRVLRDGATSFIVAGTSYADTGVVGNTSYSYTVSAADAAGNRSLESSVVQVTTPPAPVQTYRVRLTTSGYRVRAVYSGSGGIRGAQKTLPGPYGQATSVYIDAGNVASLPTCNPNDTVTSSGTVYMAVTAPAVSQHGLSILGQNITGYVSPCDLQ